MDWLKGAVLNDTFWGTTRSVMKLRIGGAIVSVLVAGLVWGIQLISGVSEDPIDMFEVSILLDDPVNNREDCGIT